MRRITAELVAGGPAGKLVTMLVREDVRFHLAIITAAKNDLMKKEILRLHLVNRVVSGPSAVERSSGRMERPAEDLPHRREVLASHEKIFQAIASSDAAAAKKEMEAHIQDIIDRSVHRLARATAEMARSLTEEEAIYSA
jgi:DNA-binding GntR family transcriptional regulator